MPLGFPREQTGDAGRVGMAAGGHYVEVNGKKVYKPTVLADRAIRFIEEKSRDAAPWMYFLSWLPPHTPYAAPPDLRAHYGGALQLQPNVPKGAPTDYARSVLPDYYGMVESLDIEFGRILAALDKAGVAEDTIVCYSSDHGDMLGSHGYEAKRWPHEESTRVPFLIRYPRTIRAGLTLPDPFSTVDVNPTLTGLAGLKAPTGLDGLDYSGLLTGKSSRAPRDYAFLQMAYAYVPWPGWRALRTREYAYARTGQGPWLLFNLAKDPHQTRNLVDDPSSRTLLAEMDKRLSATMRDSGDAWELKSTTGDLDLWLPGGPKQQTQTLGVPWPGAKLDGGAGAGGRRRQKRANRKQVN
jgi:arylsulfatase A-like enzyme